MFVLHRLLIFAIFRESMSLELQVEIEVADDQNRFQTWSYSGQRSDMQMVQDQIDKMETDAKNGKFKENSENVSNFPFRRIVSNNSLVLVDGKVYKKDKPTSIGVKDVVNKNSNESFDYNGEHIRRTKRSNKKFAGCKLDNQPEETYLAITMEIGKTAYLPCMICQKHSVLEHRIWYRFKRAKVANEILWFNEEVQYDMHDNPHLNRIFSTPDHRLVIRDFQADDAGAYFCGNRTKKPDTTSRLKFRTEDLNVESSIAMAMSWEKRLELTSIKNMVYLDVELPVQTILVSNVLDSGFPKPSRPKKNTEDNWIQFNLWSEWSACSSCGPEGERKREGHCLVRKLIEEKVSFPPYLEHVFKLYPTGAICQSSVFKHRVQISEVPKEVEVERCGDCEDALSNMARIVRKSTTMQFLEKVYTYVKSNIRNNLKNVLKEGDIVTVIRRELDTDYLPCMGYKDDSVASWYINESTLVSTLEVYNHSNHRISVQGDFSLRIEEMKLRDSGRYSCYVNDHSTIDIFLVVVAKKSKTLPKIWPEIFVFFYFFGSSIFALLLIKGFTGSQKYIKVYAFRTSKSTKTRGRVPRKIPNINTNNINRDVESGNLNNSCESDSSYNSDQAFLSGRKYSNKKHVDVVSDSSDDSSTRSDSNFSLDSDYGFDASDYHLLITK